ncbi:MAG: PhoH family protein [Phycisphaerales bacterium]
MEITIRVPASVERVPVYGTGERNLKMIREALGVNIAARDDVVRVRGEVDAVDAARRVMERLIEASEKGSSLSRREVVDVIAQAGWESSQDRKHGAHEGDAPAGRREIAPLTARERIAEAREERPEWDFSSPWTDKLNVFANGKRIEGKSANQQAYLDAIQKHDLVFGIGPAGTGKTYLAVACAIHLLRLGKVKRAVLARPAVEAGEKLGYLPGDQFAKVNPYLRPLWDALGDMLDHATIKRFLSTDVIEVVPLAFMRGRTINDAFIILDEAQNTTRGQMHMFLTRMGQRSKMVVTGDPTQIDLPDPRESGLIDASRRLRKAQGVAFASLDKVDVIRHPIVQRVIECYGEDEPPGTSALRADSSQTSSSKRRTKERAKERGSESRGTKTNG